VCCNIYSVKHTIKRHQPLRTWELVTQRVIRRCYFQSRWPKVWYIARVLLGLETPSDRLTQHCDAMCSYVTSRHVTWCGVICLQASFCRCDDCNMDTWTERRNEMSDMVSPSWRQHNQFEDNNYKYVWTVEYNIKLLSYIGTIDLDLRLTAVSLQLVTRSRLTQQ